MKSNLLLIIICVLIGTESHAQKEDRIFKFFDVYLGEAQAYIDTSYFEGQNEAIVIETKLRIKKDGRHALNLINPEKGEAETVVQEVKKKKGKYILVFLPKESLLNDYLDGDNFLILALEYEKPRR